ncbi:MAG TPA: helix-turn-helix domain-containing protein [Pseudonocardia sp.]|nr:helix-turn-helix domain-containing protein [Pseudonocardia sp.]
MPRVSSDQLTARRQHILDGARSCFSRFGYEGATVRRLEQATGLSRGAIFHHFRDKDALFFALAEQDVQRMVDVVAADGLVQVMRELLASPDSLETGWTGTFLEVARRSRTDESFRERWRGRSVALSAAIRERLERQAAAGVLRTDLPVGVLARYLELVLDGLVAGLAGGRPAPDDERALGAVLDLVEGAVRR